MAQGALAQNITIYTIRILVVSLDGGALGTYITRGRKIASGKVGELVINIGRVVSLKARAGLSGLLLYRGKERGCIQGSGRGRRARTQHVHAYLPSPLSLTTRSCRLVTFTYRTEIFTLYYFGNSLFRDRRSWGDISTLPLPKIKKAVPS